MVRVMVMVRSGQEEAAVVCGGVRGVAIDHRGGAAATMSELEERAVARSVQAVEERRAVG